jgi:hypothetical protein
MGTDLQALAGTVTLHADISIAVAALAGLKISACLGGVVRRPSVRRQKSSGVAGLALARVEECMIRPDVAQFNVPELTAVGLELEILSAEFRMALGTVFLVMATGAGLRVVE